MNGSEIQNVSRGRRWGALRRTARLYLQATGSPRRHLSREVTWSDTGLRRVRLVSKSTTVKCPLSPSPRHLKAMVSMGPLRPMALLWPGPLPALFQGPPQGSPSSGLIPPHPPHLTAKSMLLPLKGWICGSLACPQTFPRALFPKQCSLPRLQAPPSNRLTTLGHSMQKEGP